MQPDLPIEAPTHTAAATAAPRWVWALLALWILSTGLLAAVLAPVDPFIGSLCRATMTSSHRP